MKTLNSLSIFSSFSTPFLIFFKLCPWSVNSSHLSFNTNIKGCNRINIKFEDQIKKNKSKIKCEEMNNVFSTIKHPHILVFFFIVIIII